MSLVQFYARIKDSMMDWSENLLVWEQHQKFQEDKNSHFHWLFPTFIALFFALENPLLYGMAPAYDASLFATMGKMWADGGVLYRDMIDIKGPVIFLFDAWGYLIGGFQGIWLFETFFLILGLNALYRTLFLLGVSPLSRLIGMSVWMVLYAWRYYYGNMTEDYTFHLSLIAQYYFVRMLLSDHFRWRDAVFPALSFGFIAMMRMNNASMWCGYYLAIFLIWCFAKRWPDVIRLTLSGVAGLLIVALPLLGYFAWHGVLPNFWFYSFGIFFGNSYGNGHSLMVGLMGLVRTGALIFIPVFVWMVLQQQKAEDGVLLRRLLGCLATILLMGVVANSVSGHTYEHYEILFFSSAILLLPIVIHLCRWGSISVFTESTALKYAARATLLVWLGYIFAQHLIFTWSRFESPIPKMLHELSVSFFAGCIFCVLLVGAYYLHRARTLRLPVMMSLSILVLAVILVPPIKGLTKGYPFDDVSAAMVNYITENSGYDDLLWVDGITPQYYVWTDRRPASAYLFFDNVTPPYDVREKMKEDLERNKPKFIIVKLTRMEKVYSGTDKDSTPSFKAYYDYIQQAYEPVSPELPRLYRLKAE